MKRKVKQVTNLNIKPIKIKKRLRDNLNELIEKPSEELNDVLYDVPTDNKTLQKEELYKSPKPELKPKFNSLYSEQTKQPIENLGDLYTVIENDDVVILDNVNQNIEKQEKSIKNQKISTKKTTNNDSIVGDSINLNYVNNRQTLINQLVADNQQIISPNLPSGQDL